MPTDPVEEAVETLNAHLEKADEIRAHYYGKPDADRDVGGPIETVLQALTEARADADHSVNAYQEVGRFWDEAETRAEKAERKAEELQRELGARIACTYPPSYTEMRDRERARLLREARVLEKLVQDLESASESQHEDGTPEGYLPGEVLHMIDEIRQQVESEG